MTIDEYLHQLRQCKKQMARASRKLDRAESRAMAPGCGLNFGDTGRRIQTADNRNEDRLIDAADALREYRTAAGKYDEIRAQLDAAIDELKYWQGCLIARVYVYNLVFDIDDDLKGADEILHTTNRREILAKLDEAKAALTEILRARGLDIEN